MEIMYQNYKVCKNYVLYSYLELTHFAKTDEK
jgi:hypothetical protein